MVSDKTILIAVPIPNLASLGWKFFETAYRVQPYPYFYQPVSSFKNGYNFSAAADEQNVYYCFQAFQNELIKNHMKTSAGAALV